MSPDLHRSPVRCYKDLQLPSMPEAFEAASDLLASLASAEWLRSSVVFTVGDLGVGSGVIALQ